MQPETKPISRPKLTLPAEAASLLREEYAKAEVILEYGSGGSTIVAGEMPRKTVFSVESDANWAKMMEGWFVENPPAGNVLMHHVDIGPTIEWGAPASEQRWKSFPNYPFSVWKRNDFLSPDLILIDGRFRTGCFLASIFSIKRRTTILFDDYIDRQHYHFVENFFSPKVIFDKMAKFEVDPVLTVGDNLEEVARRIFDYR